MDLREIKIFLEENKNDISWIRGEEDMNNLFLHSEKWNETIKIDLNKLSEITKEGILMMLCNGKDVEQITRITGFFSKVSYWNKGKKAELRDRHRNNNVTIL